MSIFILSFLSIFPLPSQQEEIRLTEISIRYQSTFSSIPELYRLLIIDRKIEEISPITGVSGEPVRIRTKWIRKNKWTKIMSFVESEEFQSMETSTEQGIDGAWYSITSKYTNGQKKTVKIWSGYATAELINFHNLIKNEIAKRR